MATNGFFKRISRNRNKSKMFIHIGAETSGQHNHFAVTNLVFKNTKHRYLH